MFKFVDLDLSLKPEMSSDKKALFNVKVISPGKIISVRRKNSLKTRQEWILKKKRRAPAAYSLARPSPISVSN